jgi:putative phosphoribosyl transferase
LAGPFPVETAKRTTIVVDGGTATGAITGVGLQAVDCRAPEQIVLAVPVAPPEALAFLAKETDEVICMETPPMLAAIGLRYSDYH